MLNTSPKKEYESIQKQLKKLSEDVQLIKKHLETSSTPPGQSKEFKNIEISVDFSPILGKKYKMGKSNSHSIKINGNIIYSGKFSLIKSCFLFSLFLNLSRKNKNETPLDVVNIITEILIKFNQEASESKLKSSLSTLMARLRKSDYLFKDESGEKNSRQLELKFFSPPPRLELQKKVGGITQSLKEKSIEVNLVSSCNVLSKIIEQYIPCKLIDTIKQNKVDFIYGGASGFDSLFLEFFDHSFPVTEVSMYYKPSIITYPDNLLNYIGVSDQDRRRKEIMYDGLASNRINFTEILNTGYFLNLIKPNAENRYQFYPRNVTTKHIHEHIQNIIWMSKEFEGSYRLILTEEPIPFLFSSFRIGQEGFDNCYSIFFKQPIDDHDPDISCFSIFGSGIYKSISDISHTIVKSTRSYEKPSKVRSLLMSYDKQLGLSDS